MKCTCGYNIGHPLVPKCICKKPIPLTDNEIEMVMMKVGYGEIHKFVNPFDFARAIESKIRENDDKSA
jgi:hypothetical protein